MAYNTTERFKVGDLVSFCPEFFKDNPQDFYDFYHFHVGDREKYNPHYPIVEGKIATIKRCKDLDDKVFAHDTIFIKGNPWGTGAYNLQRGPLTREQLEWLKQKQPTLLSNCGYDPETLAKIKKNTLRERFLAPFTKQKQVDNHGTNILP